MTTKKIFHLNATDHKDAILKAMEKFGRDGHTVWESKAWEETGLPLEFLSRVIQNHASEKGNPKETIFSSKDGSVINECWGIYGLDALRSIANDLGCEQSRMHGRGFEAQDLTDKILKKLQ